TVKFFADYNNLALLAVAIVSGLLLIWGPIQRRLAGGGGAQVGASVATQLINRRNAVVVDVRESVEYAAGHLPQAK
ncbi:rhodanese-like domain-containing protein, partial [Acinetobacter baumannii]